MSLQWGSKPWRITMVPAGTSSGVNSDGDGASVQASFIFDIPAKEIKSVKLQLREFDKRVEITDIAMSADQHTEPKIAVKDLKPKK